MAKKFQNSTKLIKLQSVYNVICKSLSFTKLTDNSWSLASSKISNLAPGIYFAKINIYNQNSLFKFLI